MENKIISGNQLFFLIYKEVQTWNQGNPQLLSLRHEMKEVR